MEKYFINTYGCQMNIHESEKIAGILEDMGYSLAESEGEADIIVFNTCCIRETAEQKILGHIGNVKHLKKQNPNLIVAVCGCMSQQETRAEELKKSYPYVDIIFGTSNMHKFKDFVLKRKAVKKRILDIEEYKGVLEGINPHRTSGDNAWVNISYGCNNFCTYCIVPYVRGRERSRKMEDILSEIRDLLQTNQYETVTLLGQNVNSYGKDFGGGTNFEMLLKAVNDLEGDFEIKFLSSHPKDFTLSLVDTIAECEKVSREIHLPLQSGSDKILKAMNRQYTIEKYMSIVNYIKEKIPNVRLTTDIIVGFPGETEEDFECTKKVCEDVQYDGIFAFMYSKRKGTKAYDFDNQVDTETKHKRVNEILALEKQIIQNKQNV